MPRIGPAHRLLILAILASLALFGCRTRTPTPTATLTPTIDATAATPTPRPTATPTPQPLGSTGNPLVIGFAAQQQDDAQVQAANDMAVRLAQSTGEAVRSEIFPTYNALLDSLKSRQTHIAWLPPFTYLLANGAGSAEVALMTNHYGVYAYGTTFLANIDSQYSLYYDRATNTATADGVTALAQFAGKRPCWVEPTSASGYVLPVGILADAGIQTEDPVVTQSFLAVVRALYTQGICDFGATFGTYGDPRTSTSIQEAMPDIMSRVIIVWQSDAVIPNLNLSFQKAVPQGIRQEVTDALAEMLKAPDGRQLFSSANRYQIDDLKPVDDTFYEALQRFQQASGVPLFTLIGR